MMLKDEAQLVHALLYYHAQKGQLAFKWRDSLMLQACDARIDGMGILRQLVKQKKMGAVARKG